MMILQTLGSGGAYLFETDDSSKTWKQRCKLITNDYVEGEVFGSPIAMYGTRVLVVGKLSTNGLVLGRVFVLHFVAFMYWLICRSIYRNCV